MNYNHQYQRLSTILFCLTVIIISPILVQCGGQPESVTVVETVVVDKVQAVYQGAIELGNTIIKLVNEQAIEPFLVENPVTPDSVEVGFTPKYIPIRLAVDINGNILISSSSSIVTDIGAFDVGASKKIITQESGRLLIIQIDEQVAIYKLPSHRSNETFRIDFSDKYSKYRILTFEQEEKGNIILKLEQLKFDR